MRRSKADDGEVAVTALAPGAQLMMGEGRSAAAARVDISGLGWRRGVRGVEETRERWETLEKDGGDQFR